MSTRYRLIHFIPDPYTGTRIPLAALVELEEGVQLVLPEADATAVDFGGVQAAALASMICQALEDIESFEALPQSVGPQACLDTAHPIPPQIQAPSQWLRSMLRPAPELKVAS